MKFSHKGRNQNFDFFDITTNSKIILSHIFSLSLKALSIILVRGIFAAVENVDTLSIDSTSGLENNFLFSLKSDRLVIRIGSQIIVL